MPFRKNNVETRFVGKNTKSLTPSPWYFDRYIDQDLLIIRGHKGRLLILQKSLD